MASILKVQNISKRYRIGAAEKAYKTFREAIVEGITAPVRNLSRLQRLTRFTDENDEDIIWAVKDVSFEVAEGEVLGIIGNNGAGKTTLLKILSRITEPTTGEAEIYGRIASLLEVGTGFHPELTGRENIFLNGAVLGMRKSEIESKFDEIVSFSEVEKYLDTPLKRYSTGMQVRLAFAVAAHLEPEIVLIDEVLAVGDIAFQKKSLGKMEDIARGGRTVLFVSHNMGAVRSLCHRVVWLDKGEVQKIGPAEEIIDEYEERQLRQVRESVGSVKERSPEESAGKDFFFSRLEMLDEAGKPSNFFRYNDKLVLHIELGGKPLYPRYGIQCRIFSQWGQLIALFSSGSYHDIYFDENTRKIQLEIGPLILTSGSFNIALRCLYGERGTGEQGDDWENVLSFNMESQPYRPGNNVSAPQDGVFVLNHSFRALDREK